MSVVGTVCLSGGLVSPANPLEEQPLTTPDPVACVTACCHARRRYAVKVRTTVTLDDDTLALIRRRMAEQGTSFKVALNDAIREGAAGRPKPAEFTTRVADLGVPSVSLDRALQLAGELEDEELVRRQRRGV